VTFMTRTDIQS